MFQFNLQPKTFGFKVFTVKAEGRWNLPYVQYMINNCESK